MIDKLRRIAWVWAWFCGRSADAPLPDTIEGLSAEWYRSLKGWNWNSARAYARREALEKKMDQIMCDELAGRVTECRTAFNALLKSTQENPWLRGNNDKYH